MEFLHPSLTTTAEVIELIGIAILLLGAIKFLFVYLRIEAGRPAQQACTMSLMAARRGLGSYILVALEFMIVADVITTVVDRSRDNMIDLGVVVLVRTAIGFFLERELSELEPSSKPRSA